MRSKKTLAAKPAPPLPKAPAKVESEAPIPLPASPEIPEWAKETPMQTFGYWLGMEDASIYEQMIEVTRDEYIELKEYLHQARLRRADK